MISLKVNRDVFISYASEDRETVVKPLIQLMSTLGISVWFDQFDLEIGDSLRSKIDEGLKKSRFGIVILSPAFFNKHYTKLELDGLLQREVDGEKVILPIWVGVDEKQVRSFSPILADRIAGKWEDGIDVVLAKLIEVIKPGIIETWQNRITVMSRLTTGKEVIDVISGCHFSYSYNDEPDNDVEIDLVGGFIQELRDWCDIWDDIDVSSQMKAKRHISDMIDELDASGWTIYGSKMKGKRKLHGTESVWEWCAIAVVRGQPEEVLFADDRILVHKPEK